MERLGNVATPLTAATVAVPDRIPPPGLVPIDRKSVAEGLGVELPNACCTTACTAGLSAVAAVVLVGCTVKGRREAPAGAMLNAAEVAPVSAPDAAFKV